MSVVTIPLPMAEKEPIDEFASLHSNYKIENEARVTSFIRKYPFLLSLLEEAPNQIHRVFGNDVSLYLELHSDSQEGWDELFIVIKSKYSVEKAISLENRLAKEWFLDKMEVTQGKLNITEEPL